MAQKGTILVGTIGQGVMMSPDDGESWTRASVRQGMHSDCIVQGAARRIPGGRKSCTPGPTWGSIAAMMAGPDWRLHG